MTAADPQPPAVTAVREHHCGALVYVLSGPHGPPLVLDTVAVPGGAWEPQPDGRTVVPVDPDTDGWGHVEHSCVPAGQETLL